MNHPSPHDSFVKGLMKYPEAASAFFRCFLPPSVSSLLDFERLRVEPGSYVAPELVNSYSDMLFTCRMGSDPALLYFLFEHQTSVEQMMPLRMARYCVSILEDWVKANAGAKALPLILPIVLHQDIREWTAPKQLADLFGADPGVRKQFEPWLIDCGFLLVSLRDADLGKFECNLLLRMGLSLMQAVAAGRQFEWLEAHGDDLAELLNWHDGRTIIRMMLSYIAWTKPKQTTISTLRQIADKVKHQQIKSEVMTLAEACIEEGRQEGRQEGRREGLIMGQIQICEALLSRAARSIEELQRASLAELETQLSELQKEVNTRFKRG